MSDNGKIEGTEVAREPMVRGSTFQYWDLYKSGPVKTISTTTFLAENPGYESEYTKCYNACMTTGCKLVDHVWTDPKGKKYKSVLECYQWYAEGKL